MANISDVVGIAAGDAVLATVVSNNFSQVEAGINSNALNSDNYGQSSILSQHISTDAILSQHIQDSQIVSQKIKANAVLSQHISENAVISVHISNSQVVSQKISASAIVHNHLNFASSDNGLRVVQIGAASTDMPAGGVIMGRLSETFSHATTDAAPKLTLTHNFSNCEEGNPGFGAAPLLMGEPIWQLTATHANIKGPIMVQIQSINTASAVVIYQMSQSFPDAFTGTVHLGMVGE